jgi:hypothetical protein
VVKAGIGFGGEYGEGLLIIDGKPGGYYNLISGSFGFQLGVQVRSVIIMFMTERALASFERTYGWRVGVDGSVAIVTLGAGGSIDSESLTSPVIGFILDPAGLMYNLDLGRLEDQPYFALSRTLKGLAHPRFFSASEVSELGGGGGVGVSGRHDRWLSPLVSFVGSGRSGNEPANRQRRPLRRPCKRVYARYAMWEPIEMRGKDRAGA